MESFTKEQKAKIRAIVLAHYAARGGRNVRIMSDGEVAVTVPERPNSLGGYNRRHVVRAGYAADILRTGKC